MRKLVLVAAALAAAIACRVSIGSSHREAPNIMLDPAADNTDTYAFTAKDAPGVGDHRRQLDSGPGARQRPELLPVR